MPTETARPDSARVVLPAGEDLDATIRFFSEELGFRLDGIGPADSPTHARMSGHGLELELQKSTDNTAGILRIATTTGPVPRSRNAPNGTRIEFVASEPPTEIPPPAPRASIQVREKAKSVWTRGRAGMLYRDLVPDRAGGYLIASHIRIPDGGPVLDNVHHHAIGFQFIYCRRGWVRLVYEDQGEPFILEADDCVLQPPHIRHRVLEASKGLEVIELASPAMHETRLDHEMELPTRRCKPDRDYAGQTFVLHRAKEAGWAPRRDTGIEARDIGLRNATGGLVDVHVLRRRTATGSSRLEATIKRGGAFTFLFVLRGAVDIALDDLPATTLTADGACVVPVRSSLRCDRCTPDLELLEVQCPGRAGEA